MADPWAGGLGSDWDDADAGWDTTDHVDEDFVTELEEQLSQVDLRSENAQYQQQLARWTTIFQKPSHRGPCTEENVDIDGADGSDGSHSHNIIHSPLEDLPVVEWPVEEPPVEDISSFWANLSRKKKLEIVRGGLHEFDYQNTALLHTLSHFSGQRGESMLQKLEQAPDHVFMRYLKVVTSGSELPERLRHDSTVATMYDRDWCEKLYASWFLCQQAANRQCSFWTEGPEEREKHLDTDPQPHGMPPYGPRPDNHWTYRNVWPDQSGVHSFRDITYEESDPDLVQRIHNLPADLFTYLYQVFLQHTIGPDRVYVYIENLSPHILRSLPRDKLAIAQHNFVSGNTWIIPDKSVYLFRADSYLSAYYTMFKLVRRVEISLSTRDACQHCLSHVEDCLDERHRAFIPPKLGGVRYSPLELVANHEWDISEILNVYDYCIRGAMDDLGETWIERLNFVSRLQLDYLVLDMTETYELFGGPYVGMWLADKTPKFLHGVPEEFHVLVPPEQDKMAIVNAVLGNQRNNHWQ